MSTLLLIGTACAQQAVADTANKRAVSKLEFIVGDWQGEGWLLGKDGRKHTFTQTETIRFKLDSTALLIEGMGTADGKVVHDALAIVSCNRAENNYTFHSYLSNGKGGKFKAELIGDEFHWFPNETTRYTIRINERGQWYETGETGTGPDRFLFFEMTLDRR